jgi:hypothetical protein
MLKAKAKAKEKAKEAEKATTSNQVNNTKPSHAFTEYVGVYSNDAYGKFEIIQKGDSLFAKLKNQLKQYIIHAMKLNIIPRNTGHQMLLELSL